MGCKRIPGYRIPGYRIYTDDKPMATRDQVEAWITNLAEPTLSYTRDSNNVTFTLNFTPAPALLRYSNTFLLPSVIFVFAIIKITP